MSYNTRRGNPAFNKGVSASSVGNRRPVVTNNYVQQQLPPQNTRAPQAVNPGYTTTQQPAQRQQPVAQQPNAQQQLAKQQQMLVQKKQQLAQQQKQQQQKQQFVQQKQQQLAQKQLQEMAQKKELELQKQKELEEQKQKEIEEQNRQLELEQQRQRELELLKMKELELQKARELEQQKELEMQRQKELEKNLIAQYQQNQQISSGGMMTQGGELEQPIVEGMELQEPPAPPSISEETNENGAGNKFQRRWRPRRKLSKYEIQRRQNHTLSRMLQPKSAMVILNEVVKNVVYNMENVQTKEGYNFRSFIVIDGVQHEGFGTNDVAAKNNAAERALHYLVKHNKLMHLQPRKFTDKNEAGTEPMETSETEEQSSPLAWQQFASFAVYKLLSLWGEDPNLIKEDQKFSKRAARKMPANANLMNPLMLLNQMLPQAQFEELPSSTTDGHTVNFHFKCQLDGKTFFGSGTSKKMAKRRTAFAICQNILGVEYSPDVYSPPQTMPVPV